MRVVALISGGKDSCYSMMQCVAAGHTIVALANLRPQDKDEMDSYMYQTVGHDAIQLYSEALGLPLYRRVITGNALVQEKEYSPTEGDEVEDLFLLLSDIKKEIAFDGVSVGAILSDYQRIRVENVCKRLGCVSLAYLWRRDQSELLQEMIDCGMNAIIIKTASLGLDPDVHLGQSIAEMQPHLLESKGKYGINVCGEGGEYETFTLDCPLFQQSIVLDEYEKVIHSNDAFAPVGYLKLKRAHLVKKADKYNESTSNGKGDDLKAQKVLPVKGPMDYCSDLVECTKADCCDGHIELCTGIGCAGDGNKEHDNCKSTHDLKTDADAADTAADAESASNSKSLSLNGGLANNTSKTETESVAEDSPEVKVVVNKDKVKLRETMPFPEDTLRITGHSGGWLWAVGIQGKGQNQNDSSPMTDALLKLKKVLEERAMSLGDVVSICMYVSDMRDYAQYNAAYNEFFSAQPPVRVCVEAPLPPQLPLVLEALGYSAQPGAGDGSLRACMHVQGISHWAPANIGPYSQAIWVGDIIYVAGQIGLVPGSMSLVPGDVKMECKLSLRSLNRIIKATDSKVELRDVVQGICFVTDVAYIEDCRGEWEKLTNNAIVEYLVVPRLPRDARVEWQIWAHKHNTAFEYEETGCYVGSGVKVRIIRRWNYENRVSAIVCRATISNEEASFGPSEMKEMTDYALAKLLRDAETSSVECCFRVFYKLGALDPSILFDIVEAACAKFAIAFSLLPVLSLGEGNVVSFCGVRH